MFILDGAHEYEAVKLDLELWFPKVIDHGVMAFHDTVAWEGPKKVTAQSGARAVRPPYSVLENANLKRLGIDRMPPWQDALAIYLEERKTMQSNSNSPLAEPGVYRD